MYVIVPVASVGCGKSTIGKTLATVCGWGHVQNDDITGTNRRPKFLKAVLDSLENHNAVYADRNNSSHKERQELVDGLRKAHGQVTLIGLEFQVKGDAIPELKKVTQDRVFARKGHQTVSTDLLAAQKIYMIMGGFIKRFEPFTAQEHEEYAVIVEAPVLKNNTADNVLALLQQIKENEHTSPLLKDVEYTSEKVRDTVAALVAAETKSEEVLEKERQERQKNQKRKPSTKARGGPAKKQAKLGFSGKDTRKSAATAKTVDAPKTD